MHTTGRILAPDDPLLVAPNLVLNPHVNDFSDPT